VEDRWFSVDEIAEYLGVKRDTVYKWIGRKRLPAHKLGRLWKFRKSEVDEWVFANDGNRQEPLVPHEVNDAQPPRVDQACSA